MAGRQGTALGGRSRQIALKRYLNRSLDTILKNCSNDNLWGSASVMLGPHGATEAKVLDILEMAFEPFSRHIVSHLERKLTE